MIDFFQVVVIKTQPPPALRHIRVNHGRLRVARARDVQRYPSPGAGGLASLGRTSPTCLSCAPLPDLATSAPPLHLQLTDAVAPPARRESRQQPLPSTSFLRNGSSPPSLPFVSRPLCSPSLPRARSCPAPAPDTRVPVLFRRLQPRVAATAMPPPPPPPSSLQDQRHRLLSGPLAS